MEFIQYAKYYVFSLVSSDQDPVDPKFKMQILGRMNRTVGDN